MVQILTPVSVLLFLKKKKISLGFFHHSLEWYREYRFSWRPYCLYIGNLARWSFNSCKKFPKTSPAQKQTSKTWHMLNSAVPSLSWCWSVSFERRVSKVWQMRIQWQRSSSSLKRSPRLFYLKYSALLRSSPACEFFIICHLNTKASTVS